MRRGPRGDGSAVHGIANRSLRGRALVTSRRKRLAGPKHPTPRSHSPDSTSFFASFGRRPPRSAASFCGDGQVGTLARINAPDHPVLWLLERRWGHLNLAATARCDAARPSFALPQRVCSVTTIMLRPPAAPMDIPTRCGRGAGSSTAPEWPHRARQKWVVAARKRFRLEKSFGPAGDSSTPR